MSSLDRRAYRRQIGSVAQDDILYAGSLAENIAFFDPELDMAQIERVARVACIHEDIKRMPLGYDTLVGDMGSVLSGGQKQRVLIARALYMNPKMLFIDEGTAHLDEAIEAQLMGNLEKLTITRVTIAHRKSAINSAKKIFLIKDGVAYKISKNQMSSDKFL